MAGTFENVTKMAIREILDQHAQPSKFGYVLSKEGFDEVVGEIFDLLLTSRSLKSAGDRFLSTGITPSARDARRPTR